LGVDRNVFNDPIDPKSDTTFLLALNMELRTRLGRGSLVSSTAPSFGYFHRYANQRTKNLSQALAFELPLNRMTMRSGMTLLNARERPALEMEIDARVRRVVRSYNAGVDTRVSAKMTVRLDVSQTHTAYDDTQLVAGTNLAAALNRSGRAIGLSLRHSLTPLTTVVLLGEWLNDSFEARPDRNAGGVRIMPGVEFSKFALISGSAYVGYRELLPVNATVPSYRGLAARVELASVIRGGTRITGFTNRDVVFSYDIERPYFLQTSTGISVTHRLGTRWDLAGATALQRMAYHSRRAPALGETTPSATAEVAPEHSTTQMLSLGYRPSPALRVGLDGGRSQRVAATARSYSGWRVGSSITYVF
jgi:hypothetical protein